MRNLLMKWFVALLVFGTVNIGISTETKAAAVYSVQATELTTSFNLEITAPPQETLEINVKNGKKNIKRIIKTGKDGNFKLQIPKKGLTEGVYNVELSEGNQKLANGSFSYTDSPISVNLISVATNGQKAVFKVTGKPGTVFDLYLAKEGGKTEKTHIHLNKNGEYIYSKELQKGSYNTYLVNERLLKVAEAEFKIQ